jgi:ribosomal protein S18 acetylase RimI-like enzyme
MKIVECTEREFVKDFFPLLAELWYGDQYDPDNQQHVQWIQKKIHATFELFSTALCAYTDHNEPMGFLWYRHDTGLEGVALSGKDAHIISFGLFNEFKRQGVGTALVDEACKRIKQNGGECLYTDAHAANDNAMVFYIKRQFVPVALLPGLNGSDGEGQVFLCRKL